jgi:hypothetical protein
MRSFLLLAGLAFANAHDDTKCALNGARAVDDMLDSAVYIMASIVRCDKSNGIEADAIRCSLDISSAIESVNGMVNVILKAVDKCGKLKTDNHKCGLAVGVLIEGYAGLAAASSGIVAKCPNALNHFHPLETVGQAMNNAAASAGHNNNWGHGNAIATLPGQAAGNANFVNLQGGAALGQCIVNVKNTMKSLFKAIARIMTIKHNCKDPESKHCAHNSLKIMSGFIGMGEFLSGAIGKCTPMESAENYKTKSDAICAQYSLKLVHQLGVVDRASIQMSKDCELTGAQRARLYAEEQEDVDTSDRAAPVSLGLVALFPICAVLAFVAGSRFAKTRAQIPQQDCESLMSVEE